MWLRITEPVIVKENPFLNDKLNRKQCAQVLTGIFRNINGPFVMSLNSPLGTGKTFFIKMFRHYLLNAGFPSIYFNTWENDFQDNPLIAFIGEIYSGINELHELGFGTERTVKVFKKIKKSGKDILKKSIPVAVKTSGQKSLDIEKGVDDVFSDISTAVLENQIKNYSLTREHVKKFKEHLKELVTELQKSSHEKKTMPLIFFIDGLDRCRPDYAVQLLEKTRHYLYVDGIIFVLGTDMEQLGLSVKTVFGQNTRERSYLRKFIDLDYNLPADNNTIELYCHYLSSGTAITDLIKKNNNPETLITELKYSAMLMAISFSLSLSDLNAMFNFLYLIFLTCDVLETETISLSVILISLKIRNVKLFNQVVNKERTVYYVINELNKMKKTNDSLKEYDKYFFEKRLGLLALKKISDEEYQLQLKPGSFPGNNELNSMYKIIKDKNRLNEAESFTGKFLKKIRLLDYFNTSEIIQ